MKVYLFLLFQVIVMSLYSQKNSSITVSFFDNYLSGNQFEVKTTVYLFSTQIGINFGIATDLSSFENDHTLKAGVVYDLYRKDKFSIGIGTRFVFERFHSEEFNTVKFAYNYDFPIDIKYDFLPRFNISMAIIPTWNKYHAYDNNVALSFSAGLGYYF